MLAIFFSLDIDTSAVGPTLCAEDETRVGGDGTSGGFARRSVRAKLAFVGLKNLSLLALNLCFFRR